MFIKFLTIRCGSILTILLTLINLCACEDKDGNSAPKETTKGKRASLSNSKSALNLDDIVAKSERSSYHYYFTALETVNRNYSRRRGYFNDLDAQKDPDKPVIEIQSDPEGGGIIRVYYKMVGLPSLDVSRDEMKPMLTFVKMFDSSAADVFERNFNTIFHYAPNGPDSNHYYNKTKGISIGIDHNLDIVKADRLSARDAYIQACIMPY